MVLMLSPVFDDRPRVVEIQEPVQVQAVPPEFAVEAFDEGILCQLAGLDEVQLDLSLC